MEYGPFLAATAMLLLSLAAKMFMSFGVRVKQAGGGNGYQLPDADHRLQEQAKIDNVSKAQLNVAEYEALFIAVFLLWDLKDTDSILVTIVCYVVPIAQAVYFWGRALSGEPMPWAPLGALPRYASMLITAYVCWTVVTKSGMTYGPGLAFVAVFVVSMSAKFMMSFGFRVANKEPGDTGKAQLNVAEYEALFMAILLFFYYKKVDGILVTIVSYVFPIAQAVYFWGRALSGKMMPWGPLGALPRYISMGISVYILYTNVSTSTYGPGLAAVAVLFLSLASKLMMSFGFRALDKEPGDAGKAQLNVAEYDPLFLVILLYWEIKKADSLLITIVSYIFPIAQAIYFWGRVLTGKVMPWAPLGALPRYIGMGISIYVFYTMANQ